jgi:thiosulfate/3-mercaptopyruvate sulfurtransferase
MRRILLLVAACTLLFAADPWTPADVITPEQAAPRVKSSTTDGPFIIHVGFSVLYRAAHITGSKYAGPGSTPAGIEELKKEVAGQPRTREIDLYCGCCPWDKCPNIRPAFAALHEMGFQNVKVIQIPENLKADWIDKGYPTDKRTEEAAQAR